MFADSVILHALTEAQSEQSKDNQERIMSTKVEKQQPQHQAQSQQQSQQSSPSPSSAGVQPQPERTPHLDPLGRPMYQGSPRFTDQQAGGDLTGDESDARDDNFIDSSKGQSARDVSGHAAKLPPTSAELLRSMAVGGVPDQSATAQSIPQAVKEHADKEPEPDGTEYPGANADDGLVPRKKDGTGSEQH